MLNQYLCSLDFRFVKWFNIYVVLISDLSSDLKKMGNSESQQLCANFSPEEISRLAKRFVEHC